MEGHLDVHDVALRAEEGAQLVGQRGARQRRGQVGDKDGVGGVGLEAAAVVAVAVVAVAGRVGAWGAKGHACELEDGVCVCVWFASILGLDLFQIKKGLLRIKLSLAANNLPRCKLMV